MLPDSTIKTNLLSKKHSDRTLSYLKPWPVADSTYANLLTKKQRNILDSACKEHHKFNIIEWANMRPMSAINLTKTIIRAEGNTRIKSKVATKVLPDNDSLKIYILDYYLLNQAKLNEMKIFGLDTREEYRMNQDSILSYIPQLSYRTEVDLFIYYLENYRQIDSLNYDHESRLMLLYFNQDLDNMLQLESGIKTNTELVNWWRGYDNSEIVKRLIIDNRNALWIQRVPELIQEASSFIAVGAGHLGGENGLIEQLRALNYTVVSMEKAINEK